MFVGEVSEHLSDIASDCVGIQFFSKQPGQQGHFAGFQARPQLQSDSFPKEPLDPVAVSRRAVTPGNQNPVPKAIGGQIHEGEVPPRVSRAQFQQVGDFQPAFEAQTTGKAIFFGQL